MSQEQLLATTPSAVRKLLVEVIEAVTGYTRGRVLIETLTDRRPADGSPYATIWFKNTEPLVQNNGDFIFNDDDIESQILDNETLCTVQISFWGNGAYEEAIRCMQTMQNQARFFDLWRVLGFAGIDSVQDISTQYGAKIQQRAYFNLDFYVCFGRKYPADWFDVSQWGIRLPEKPYSEELQVPTGG